MEEPTIEFKINERCTRAIHSAVCYTLNRWAGEGDMDQEQLLALKPFLQGCVFEFEFNRVE
jgi:hypothetical protein